MLKPSFYLATLGCKVNQYESHALREAWQSQGWREAGGPEEATFILVNSCAVTARAVADLRNTVRRLHRAAPKAGIVITGCAAQVLETELAALPGVVRVVPQSDKDSLLKAPEAPSVLSPLPPMQKACPAYSIAESSSVPPFPAFALSGYDRSRAVLKIQDGCSHGCTYCIVPLTRGRARSRSLQDSLAEAGRLLEAGFREIVISGVNLRQYRQEHQNGNGGFWDFLGELDSRLAPVWEGRARIRISSLEPGQLTEQGLETIRSCRLLCPHLHLSLQSGSPSVLRRMGRGHYDPADMLVFLEELRKLWPVYGLGADILTGFPGETDEEFAKGMEFCRSLPLTYAHVFPYSKRPGTRAASMPGQIAQEVKKERAARLRSLVRDKKLDFVRQLAGLPDMRVVFEAGQEAGRKPASAPWQGLNEYYVECRLEGQPDAIDSIKPGRLTRVYPIPPAGDDDGLLRVSLFPWGQGYAKERL